MSRVAQIGVAALFAALAAASAVSFAGAASQSGTAGAMKCDPGVCFIAIF